MAVGVVIPARSGATRFPGKALAPVDAGGETLLARVIRRVRAWGGARAIAVATDDAAVAEAARRAGAIAALTGPARTGSDRVARIAPELGCDLVVNVQVDEIDVDGAALEAAVAAAEGAHVGTVACPARPGDLHRRDVVKVVTAADGTALYFSRAPIPGDRHLGLYAARCAVWHTFSALPSGALERAEDLEQLRAMESGLRVRVRRVPGRYRSINRPEDLAPEEAI